MSSTLGQKKIENIHLIPNHRSFVLFCFFLFVFFLLLLFWAVAFAVSLFVAVCVCVYSAQCDNNKIRAIYQICRFLYSQSYRIDCVLIDNFIKYGCRALSIRFFVVGLLHAIYLQTIEIVTTIVSTSCLFFFLYDFPAS